MTTYQVLTPDIVPLRRGPPTREELLVYYPAKFTWKQLKTFVNSGDLGLLKRDKRLQRRYDEWARDIRDEYGSMVNYLLNKRLQWGKRDTLSLLSSSIENDDTDYAYGDVYNYAGGLPEIPEDAPPYFTADTPRQLISIIMNDWPYSVPYDVEHSLIWTRLPIYPTTLPQPVAQRILQDGLWGFTGCVESPPSPDTLPEHLHVLAEWGVTMDKLIRSPPGPPEEEAMVQEVGKGIATFIRRRWTEDAWETAWFVNPPRLQSVPGLAHAHVFARRKTHEERGMPVVV